MSRRLERSVGFLNTWVLPEIRNRGTKGRGCDSIRVHYIGCGHEGIEHRECAVHNVRPGTVFRLREPNLFNSRDGCCQRCHEVVRKLPGPWRSGEPDWRRRLYVDDFTASNALAHKKALRVPPSKTRELHENEIRALCEALVLATNETPLGSTIQKALVDHICGTYVQEWGDFTVCTFLET